MIQESLRQLLLSMDRCKDEHISGLLSDSAGVEYAVQLTSNRLHTRPDSTQQLFSCFDWKQLGFCEKRFIQQNQSQSNDQHYVDRLANLYMFRSCCEQSIQDTVLNHPNANCSSTMDGLTLLRFARFISNELWLHLYRNKLQPLLVDDSKSNQSKTAIVEQRLHQSVLGYTQRHVDDRECEERPTDLLQFCVRTYTQHAYDTIKLMNRSLMENQATMNSTLLVNDQERQTLKKLCWLVKEIHLSLSNDFLFSL